MKNKFLTLILIFFVFNSFAFSQEFNFKTKKIEISENGKLINATNGKAVSSDGDLEISANEFRYSKDENILSIYGNGVMLIKLQNLKIFFDNSVVDQNKLTIQANGNVKILDKKTNLDNISESIFYDQNLNYIKSDSKTNIKDSNQNNYLVDKFN